MNVLLDTCVIIDYLQKREPFHVSANTIMLMAANEEINVCTTAKAVTDIYYILHRATHDDKKTRNILSSLLLVARLLDTASDDCRNALLSPMHDFEDAVMEETAKREKMDCIVTRNEKDYSASSVPVYSPEVFLKLFHPQ